jgi:uncharacterized protein
VVRVKAKSKSTSAQQTIDSFSNLASSVGLTNGTNQTSGSHYNFSPITRIRLQLEYSYRSSWVVGRGVDVVARDMTRERVEINSTDDPGKLQELDKEVARLQLWSQLCDTLKWSRLYGGAIAFFMIDGQDPATPLRVETLQKGQFKGLLPMDRWLLNPSLNNLVSDYGPDFGLPIFYETVSDVMGIPRMKIHHSRMIRFGGLGLPFWQKISENLWGISILERIWDRLIAFDSTTTGVAQLVYKAHLRTYKVKNLRDIAAMGGQALIALSRQIAFIRMFQTNEGMTLMDATDEFETHQYAFSGLDQVLVQFGEQLCGALEIPAVKLFGQSPAGFNSGDSDLRSYNESIKQHQESDLGPGVEKLYRVTYISTFGAEPPKSFEIKFRPLTQLDAQQKAEVAAVTFDGIVKLYEAQIIDRATALKEVKQCSRDTGIGSNVTDEAIETAEDDPPPSPEALGLEVPKPPAPGLGGEGGDPGKVGLPKPKLDDSGGQPDSFTIDAWEENKHPRADNGEFGSGSGGANSSTKLAKKQALTANEKATLASYSGDDFLRVNKALREGDDSDPAVKRLDSAIGKNSIPEGKALYRGMTREAAKQLFKGGSITNGEELSDKAFVSTSKSEGEARARGMGGVILKIVPGPHAKGLDMGEHSDNKSEDEVLLPRNAKMKITGFSKPTSLGAPVIVHVAYGHDQSDA